MKNILVKFSLVACLAGYITMFSLFPKWNATGIHSTISWDISGYYLYLPALFIHKDITQLQFFDQILEDYNPTTSFNQAYKSGDNYVLKYPLGMAMMYAPGFIGGHIGALLSDFPADGFSYPYQIGLYIWSLIVSFIGLILLAILLVKYFSDKISAIVLLIIGMGTNYFNYAAYDNPMPHNYLFSLLALLVLLTISFYKKPGITKALIIGGTIGLATITRPTEIIWVLVPLFWGLRNFRDLSERFRFFFNQWKYLLVTSIGFFFFLSFQLMYWKIVSGTFVQYSYQDQGFSWLKPHIFEVLFSYRKGWLVYTPVMVLSLLGFFSFRKRLPRLYSCFLLALLINFYIVSAWDIWWYGGGFGQRAMIQSYVLLAFPLAAFIEFSWSKTLLKYIVGLFIAACITLNIFQTWQAYFGPFEADSMTKAYYWRSFGKTKDHAFDKFLLDTPEDYKAELINPKTLLEDDFESSNADLAAFAKSGVRAHFVTSTKDFDEVLQIDIPNDREAFDWLRVSGELLCTSKEWETWAIPQLICQIYKGDQLKKVRMIRTHRVLWYGTWKRVWMDFKIPSGEGLSLKVSLWNPSNTSDLFMDDVRVELH